MATQTYKLRFATRKIAVQKTNYNLLLPPCLCSLLPLSRLWWIATIATIATTISAAKEIYKKINNKFRLITWDLCIILIDSTTLFLIKIYKNSKKKLSNSKNHFSIININNKMKKAKITISKMKMKSLKSSSIHLITIMSIAILLIIKIISINSVKTYDLSLLLAPWPALIIIRIV